MIDQGVNPAEAQEDQFAATIAKPTSRATSGAYLGLGLCAVVLSSVLQGMNKKNAATFIGQWAVPFLLLGIYNKLVRQNWSAGGSRNEDLVGSRETGSGSPEARLEATEKWCS
jgi:hypothetical protein